IMCVGIIPASALPVWAGSSSGSGEVTFTYENPLYSGETYTYSADTYLSDASTVVEEIRTAMVARESTVTVTLDADVVPSEAYLKALVEEVFAETGVSDEGDYLRWSYGKYTASAVSVSDVYSVTITFTYYTTAEQEEAVTEKVAEVIESFGFTDETTDYEKVLAVYDYICENVEYDYAGLSDSSDLLKYTAYGALIENSAVCQGYAALVYRFITEIGISARMIAGTSSGTNHAWNIVKLGSCYYNLDSTWDAGSSSYSYFLKCSDNFADHTRNTEYTTDDFNAAYPMASVDYDPTETDWDSLVDAAITKDLDDIFSQVGFYASSHYFDLGEDAYVSLVYMFVDFYVCSNDEFDVYLDDPTYEYSSYVIPYDLFMAIADDMFVTYSDMKEYLTSMYTPLYDEETDTVTIVVYGGQGGLGYSWMTFETYEDEDYIYVQGFRYGYEDVNVTEDMVENVDYYITDGGYTIELLAPLELVLVRSGDGYKIAAYRETDKYIIDDVLYCLDEDGNATRYYPVSVSFTCDVLDTVTALDAVIDGEAKTFSSTDGEVTVTFSQGFDAYFNGRAWQMQTMAVMFDIETTDEYFVSSVTYTDKNNEDAELTEFSFGGYHVLPSYYMMLNVEIKPSNPFPDVETDVQWFSEYVLWAYQNGYVKGMEDGTFAPDETMTRAQFVTILYRIITGGDEAYVSENECPFTDVAAGQWFYRYVMWAYDNKIINGTSDTTFSPDEEVTREQIAVILYRAFTDEEEVTYDLSRFSDADKIDDYALNAMKWAVSIGLYEGDPGGTIRPRDAATRAEASKILYLFSNEVMAD
ncbi:MAG: S-layer homology domain-containing protein, partial [Firmicutes bacterium]|nr:S-layer homology domain-containing protein [Bacillota bacterium]